MAVHEGGAQVDLSVSDDVGNLGRVVVSLLKKWNLSEEQQLALLGIETGDGASLSGHEIGAQPLPAAPEVVQRAAQLIAIHRSLRVLFPENEDLRFSWVARRNQAFGGSAPIDVMLSDGRNGVARVRAVLDQQCMQ